jgi:hypothetical protein
MVHVPAKVDSVYSVSLRSACLSLVRRGPLPVETPQPEIAAVIKDSAFTMEVDFA